MNDQESRTRGQKRFGQFFTTDQISLLKSPKDGIKIQIKPLHAAIVMLGDSPLGVSVEIVLLLTIFTKFRANFDKKDNKVDILCFRYKIIK